MSDAGDSQSSHICQPPLHNIQLPTLHSHKNIKCFNYGYSRVPKLPDLSVLLGIEISGLNPVPV